MDFFQCFNFFHAGLVFCEVLDFYGEIFKHSYRFLQLHKIFPCHWLASFIYTIHIKDAEKVQQEAPNGVQGIHWPKNSFRRLDYSLSLTILTSYGLNGGLSLKIIYL